MITDEIGYYILNNDRMLSLSSGRMVAPVALHVYENEKLDPGRAMCYLSDDHGRTWRRSKSVIRLNEDSMGTGLQEPGAVALEGGRLMMFSRTGNGVQYLSYSEDCGDTWSEPEKSSIVSPCSPASIKRIPIDSGRGTAIRRSDGRRSGDLLLVWNKNYEVGQRGGGRRTPLNTAVSKDEGETWENIKVLEDDPHGWYCYTAIEFVDDRVLLGHCAGDRRTGGLSTTQITMFPVDWLYQ